MVCTFVLSTVGLYTSDSTPPATVYQTFEERSTAVPTQSLRARSKCDSAPGAPGAVPPGGPTEVEVAAAAAGAAGRTVARSTPLARTVLPKTTVAFIPGADHAGRTRGNC